MEAQTPPQQYGDRRQTAHGQQSIADTVVDISYWAWGGNGRIGVDETLRDIKDALAEQKKRDKILGIAIAGGILLANPVTAYLVEPWLKALGK